MNIITTTGRLVKDAEIRTTSNNDQKYVLFTVASNFLYGERAEKAKENNQPDAFFYNVMAWGDFYTNYFGDLKKGEQVIVIGDLSYHVYEDNNGVQQSGFSINPSKIERVSTPKNEGQQKADKPWG